MPPRGGSNTPTNPVDREARVRLIQQRLNKGLKVPYYGLVDPQTGDLTSVGTEAMFEGGVRPEGNIYANCEIIDFGSQSPNFQLKVWDRVGKVMRDRPAPIIISRLDDFQQRLLNDPDFSTAWAALNATRRQQIRDGFRRVLAQMLGSQQFRGESDEVEL